MDKKDLQKKVNELIKLRKIINEKPNFRFAFSYVSTCLVLLSLIMLTDLNIFIVLGSAVLTLLVTYFILFRNIKTVEQRIDQTLINYDAINKEAFNEFKAQVKTDNRVTNENFEKWLSIEIDAIDDKVNKLKPNENISFAKK